MKKITSLFAIAALAAVPLVSAHSDEEHAKGGGEGTTTVKGEVLDLVCYVDHGAQGEKHAGCAEKCISSGLPVGVKAGDGKVYTVVGNHAPINKELAQYAGKTVTLRGKVTSKDGINLLENAEIVK